MAAYLLTEPSIIAANPSRATGTNHGHQRSGAALGDRHRWRAGQQVDIDSLPRRDFPRPPWWDASHQVLGCAQGRFRNLK